MNFFVIRLNFVLTPNLGVGFLCMNLMGTLKELLSVSQYINVSKKNFNNKLLESFALTPLIEFPICSITNKHTL